MIELEVVKICCKVIIVLLKEDQRYTWPALRGQSNVKETVTITAVLLNTPRQNSKRRGDAAVLPDRFSTFVTSVIK